MTPITLWYRLNEKKQWEYNHLDYGQDPNLTSPPPIHPDHVKMWKSGKWQFAFAELQDGRISKVVNIQPVVTCQ